MTPNDWKHILISIFVGACVAFLTTFLDGFRQLLTNPGTHLAGSATGMLWYAFSHRA